MIDFLHAYITIPIPQNSFRWMLWKKSLPENGSINYWHQCNGVYLRYYPSNNHLTLQGKLIRLLHDTWVLNPDDLYQDELQLFIDQINAKLNRLFTRPLIDIRNFTVTRLDYCFNVHTEYVKEYIDFLNTAFRMTDKNVRKNYAKEAQVYGSVYVKTNHDYDENARNNYVLNFYDKADWAHNQINKGRYISPEDMKHAQNTLRLEVQCCHNYLRKFCKKHNIKRTFGDLFRYDLALKAEEEIYGLVFRCNAAQDFYTYETAKKLLPKSKAALNALYLSATNHSIAKDEYYHGRKRIQEASIFPYCFLPRGMKPDMLKNPIKLIEKKLADMDIPIQ